MAPELAIEHLPELAGEQEVDVLDPMCGSGTVLYEAVARSHRAIGLDIDPLAVLMTKVATQPLEAEEYSDALAYVSSRLRSKEEYEDPWSADDLETRDFVSYWFGTEQAAAIAKLSGVLRELGSGPVQDALQIALSRTIITKSPRASLAADTAHSRPHRVATESQFDVFNGFIRSAEYLDRLLGRRVLKGSASVSVGDARDLSAIPDNSFDLAITSPPYLNALDYMRGHKLSLVWLGYSIPELRRIRRNSIGAERALDGDAHEWVAGAVSELQSAAVDPALLPIRIITRYVHDLRLLAGQLALKMRKGGRVVMVVGNSTLKGNFIANDQIASGALEDAGFEIESRRERDIPQSRRYMPMSTKSTLNKRMRTEVVFSARSN